ncbi:hypothetical protein C9374_008601 [Naegleria lovaniensis]|uniref:UDENN domain-containing protein n=1 Tax=Naegleria lovaniensis TaxID=51637 RepID=A0AA88GEN0_NAELO|nr:uncharacterized protein C9374_008601 [Naegleria lovaniensis]KAG2377979.1 hypothetical protein C9374_008601 [Naegleria lovaniensis]
MDIEYIFLAEFDIDKGSILKVQYPTAYPYDSEYSIANLMLPDGSHNCVEDTTVFFLRGKQNTQSDGNEIFYHVLNVQKQKKYEGVRRGARVKSLAIASKKPYCFSLRDLLSKALDQIFEAYDHTMYSKERRKLDDISELDDPNDSKLMDDLVQTLVEHIFETCNGIKISNTSIYSEQERIFWRYVVAKTKFTNYNHTASFQYGNRVDNITLSIPLCLSENEIQYRINGITQISLCRLVSTFKEDTMLIYNAILYQKRVVFFSSQQLAGQVVNAVLSAIAMFPEMHNLLRTRTFPYASFSNLEFLNVEGYIVGVCNPMFACREEYYDLLVDIDKAEVKVNQSFTEVHKELKKIEKKEKKDKKKRRGSKPNVLDAKYSTTPVSQEKTLFDSVLTDTLDIIDTIGNTVGVIKSKAFDDICYLTQDDLRFIKDLIVLIQFKTPKTNGFEMLEDLIRSKFYSYSKSIVDLAFDQEKQILYQQQVYHGTSLTQDPITDNIKKALSWRATLSFKHNKKTYISGKRQAYISPDIIDMKSCVQRLRSTVLNEEELITMFQLFIKHVNTREEILEFLTFFPENEGGIYPIALCTLHSSELMRLLSVSFLRRIESIDEGKLLVQNMNMFLLLGYDRGAKLY